ncbi:MAG: dihydroneopterin triphosphate diphosphatase [Gammaproteobacteria bacterium]|nr:dihydroneopterin triphosphate diphosphatase [Gammaproteobacteria bacterium]
MAQRDFKRPESVLVLVYTRAGEVLLLERCHPAGYWQSVTGSLEWGEAAESAARRELEEETGLVAADLIDCHHSNRFPIHPAWRVRYASEVRFNTEYVFRLEYKERPDVRLHCAEHVRSLWLPRREAAEQVASATNREAILRFVPEN